MEKNALRMPMYFGDLVAVLDGDAPDDCGISLYVESEKYRILVARFSCGVLDPKTELLLRGSGMIAARMNPPALFV